MYMEGQRNPRFGAKANRRMVLPTIGQEAQGEHQVGGKIVEGVDTELSFKVL